MFKRNCVVKFVDSFGVEHAAKVEAESLLEAAVRGLHQSDSSFWTEEDSLSTKQPGVNGPGARPQHY